MTPILQNVKKPLASVVHCRIVLLLMLLERCVCEREDMYTSIGVGRSPSGLAKRAAIPCAFQCRNQDACVGFTIDYNQAGQCEIYSNYVPCPGTEGVLCMKKNSKSATDNVSMYFSNIFI